MTDNRLTPLLYLFHTKGVSAAALRQVIKNCQTGSPSDNTLVDAGRDASERDTIHKALYHSRAGTDTPEARLVQIALRWAAEPNHCILPANASEYPAILREIPDYPPLLFVRGDPQVLARPMIAIVGSRSSTAYGRSVAYRIAADLAAMGLVVCSGLASGIDTQAHLAALDNGAATVAVLGNGLSSIYPPGNRGLADRIAGSNSCGALVSELPLAAGPVAQHFPQRNRIISGLSLGTVVVEANMRSGSLITARLALEQNREVFAVPGSVNNSVSRGCHRLIRQGAVLTETADDIVSHIRFLCQAQMSMCFPDFEFSDITLAQSKKQKVKMSPDSRVVMSALSDDPITADQLMVHTGLGFADLSAKLLELELSGLVGHEGNRWWRLP